MEDLGSPAAGYRALAAAVLAMAARDGADEWLHDLGPDGGGALAVELGIPVAAVQRRARGLVERPDVILNHYRARREHRRGVHYPHELVECADEMQAAGWSFAQIAVELGVGQDAMQRAVRRYRLTGRHDDERD